MTDKNKSNKTLQRGGRRRRKRIFGDRVTVSVRIDPELHERMMNLCDILSIPANTYIVSLVESDLKKRKK